VRAYKKTICADPDSCTSEHIPEPAEVVVQRYVRALWPKLKKVLTCREAVQVFVAELNRMAEKSFADSPSSGSSHVRKSDLPSYLMKLNLPVRAVLDSVANA
jgi:hypothetical protein